MFDHAKDLSCEYYQVNKVGNIMSLFTNDLDTIQECFAWGMLMFFDATFLGGLAIVKMWNMDHVLTLSLLSITLRNILKVPLNFITIYYILFSFLKPLHSNSYLMTPRHQHTVRS